MHPPDVTNNPAEWSRLENRTPLWQNKLHLDVFSTDGGKTFTIATERVQEDIPRLVRTSRKV